MISLSNGLASLAIRSPLLGDTQTIKNTGFFRRARNHQLYGYKKTPIRTLSLHFADLNRPEINALVAFLKASVNLDITLVLDNGDTWIGAVMNDFESIHVGHASSTFSLEFEGQML